MDKGWHDASNSGRNLALGLLGGSVFGAASGVGHGLSAAVRGAWTAPALFVGGALLAAPPLYLMVALSGGQGSPRAVFDSSVKKLAAVGIALMGLSAPAAFFSATLRTASAQLLLTAVLVCVGAVSVFAVAGERMAAEKALKPRIAGIAWSVFALALGARLMSSLAHAAGV
jgi:hypothetical protein